MVSSHKTRPIGFNGPEEHIWSSEGTEHPAWRVLVLYGDYNQEFWFMSEQAAVSYILNLRTETDVSAPETHER